MVYNMDNTAVRDIILYFKHVMCDAQQKKAKSFGFDQLDDETYLWLKDFSQKILPKKFGEGWKEYFGKKEMSLHNDIFFPENSNHVSKRLYLLSNIQYDKGMIDTLSLGKAVLKKLEEWSSGIKHYYQNKNVPGSKTTRHSAVLREQTEVPSDLRVKHIKTQ